MIPMNDVVKVYKGENKDSWGIVTSSTVPTELKGMVSYSTKLEEMTTAEGEKVVITANIAVKGDAEIVVGDLVDIGTGTKLKVLQALPIKDLSGVTVLKKVVV